MKPPDIRPILVEIIGVAGTGKSSLARALASDGYTEPPFISASNPRHLVVLLRALPRLWAHFVGNLARRPRMSWADFKLMAYVTGWREFLRGSPEYRDSTLIFDQGPLYALGRLEAKGLGVASTPTFRRWWDEMLSAWAAEISLVIWLDAADAELARRINQRSQGHVIKGRPIEESDRFLRHYRDVFAEVLRRVESEATEVVRFDTTTLDLEELTDTARNLIRSHSSQ